MKGINLPSRSEWLFSIKCLAAAVLAVGLANWCGQPRPFWAMMTSYIVANPMAGAVRSKAMFRLLGTVVGSTAAIFIVPLFVNSPILLTLALGCWVAGCLYGSLLDRTPRGYLFMLAGYTAALVGFPSVDMPLHTFDTGIARMEEVGFGILSATLVHSLVLPQSLKSSVVGLLDKMLSDSRSWMKDIMVRKDDGTSLLNAQPDRRKVAGDIAQLRGLATHIPFDTSHLRWGGDAIEHLQQSVTALTPDVSAIEDRIEAIVKHEGGYPADIQRVLQLTNEWLDSLTPNGRPDRMALPLQQLRLQLAMLKESRAADDWARALCISLAERMNGLIEGWLACLEARASVDEALDGRRPTHHDVKRPSRLFATHIDHGIALLSAVAALGAIVLCCSFWYATGWAGGSVAAMMGAIFCCFFATMDDPAPAIKNFLTWTLWSIPVSTIYVLFLMPLITDVVTLAVVCGLFLVPVAWFIARPSTMGKALPLAMGVLGTWSLHDTSTPDLVNLANSMLAQVLGVIVAVVCTRIMRSVGADWMARRIQRSTWHELDELSRSSARRAGHLGTLFTHRMLDRIAQLTPRVAQSGGQLEGVPTEEAIRDLRLGTDIVALQNARWEGDKSVELALTDIGRWFAARASKFSSTPPTPSIAHHLDDALKVSLNANVSTHDTARISALVGLRRNLFPELAWTNSLPSPLE